MTALGEAILAAVYEFHSDETRWRVASHQLGDARVSQPQIEDYVLGALCRSARGDCVLTTVDGVVTLTPTQKDHYVIFNETGWFMEHTAACRVAGALSDCAFHKSIVEIAEDDPDFYGRWVITGIDEEGLPSMKRAGNP